jgi:hypothetical protein
MVCPVIGSGSGTLEAKHARSLFLLTKLTEAASASGPRRRRLPRLISAALHFSAAPVETKGHGVAKLLTVLCVSEQQDKSGKLGIRNLQLDPGQRQPLPQSPCRSGASQLAEIHARNGYEVAASRMIVLPASGGIVLPDVRVGGGVVVLLIFLLAGKFESGSPTICKGLTRVRRVRLFR